MYNVFVDTLTIPDEDPEFAQELEDYGITAVVLDEKGPTGGFELHLLCEDKDSLKQWLIDNDYDLDEHVIDRSQL